MRRIFTHSGMDAVLVAVALLQLGLTAFVVAEFPALGATTLVGLGAALVFLTCTNYQCIAHNHIHNPFFRSARLNALFSALNSLGLGMPATIYRFHHLNHHRFNNDLPDAATGDTRDRSSTYRYAGRGGAAEGLLAYSVLGVFRTDLGVLHADAKKKGLARHVWLETALVVLAAAAVLAARPSCFFAFYLPVWFLGQVAAFAENYLEHAHATPGNRLTDSVSSYSALYNLVWFNNGYHQEHHFRPQLHWTQIRAVRAEMLPESERRVVRGAHWFNLTPPRARLESSAPSWESGLAGV